MLGLPRTARLPVPQLWRRMPLFCVGAGLVGLGLLSLTAWMLGLAFGATGMVLLTPALVASALAGIVCWAGLARMRGPRR